MLAVLAIVAVLVIGIYNNLVGLRQSVRQGVADIDAQLRQRHDLIPNLVETVKGYAAHESDTLEAVIAARNAAASGAPESGAEQQLKSALGNLLALGEAYPDLKASANFQSLQHELADVEDKLAAARRAARSDSPRPISTGLMQASRGRSTRCLGSGSERGRISAENPAISVTFRSCFSGCL